MQAPLITDTCAEIVREQIPNFFRLYLNPYVVQTCFCLSRYAQTVSQAGKPDVLFQTFLANSFDEALSGAIKLARYDANLKNRPVSGLVIDPDSKLGPFASISFPNQGKVEFIRDLVVVESCEPIR